MTAAMTDHTKLRAMLAKQRYEVGMHIASANAITDKRTQIGPDDAIVKAEGGAA